MTDPRYRRLACRRVVGLTALACVWASCADQADELLDQDERGGVFDEQGEVLGQGGKADDLFTSSPSYGPLPEGWSAQPALQVLFAPDDPVVTLELELIRRTVAARQADPAAYAEGDNPYRIRYAVYNLRNPQIVAALADAERDGVDVQILIEAAQLDPAKTHNDADEVLVSRGFELIQDHRTLTPATMKTADMIGVKSSGLMHLKARLFDTPTWRLMLTGSMNPGDNAALNEETLHLISHSPTLDKYHAAYEAIRAGKRLQNVWDDAAAINVLFTPEGAGARANTKLFDWIKEEREQILMMVFSLRNITAAGHKETLVQLLGQKVREGVPVYVITDRKQSDGVDAQGNRVTSWDDRTDDDLRRAGVTVYEAINAATPFTAMHHKVGVFGRTRVRVVTDAANWTAAGLGSSTRKSGNVESQLFIDTSRLDDGLTGRRYVAQFMRVLERYASQSPESPSFAQVYGDLSARPGWPTVPLSFVGHQIQTLWGESARVRGDHAALGAWGQVHSGLRMTTDSRSYPTWRSQEEVSAPLGAPLRYKFVITRQGAQDRWERGADRLGLAQPSALDPSGVARHVGVWR